MVTLYNFGSVSSENEWYRVCRRFKVSIKFFAVKNGGDTELRVYWNQRSEPHLDKIARRTSCEYLDTTKSET
jgi:hypothetical protein